MEHAGSVLCSAMLISLKKILNINEDPLSKGVWVSSIDKLLNRLLNHCFSNVFFLEISYATLICRLFLELDTRKSKSMWIYNFFISLLNGTWCWNHNLLIILSWFGTPLFSIFLLLLIPLKDTLAIYLKILFVWAFIFFFLQLRHIIFYLLLH